MNVSVHAPMSGEAPLDFEAWRAAVVERIAGLPMFRHRPFVPPLELSPSFWLADPKFEVDRHLHRVSLGGEASLEDLSEVVSRAASSLLPRDRPLWELTFVEGLAGGRTAEVLKLHHAIADGGRLASLFERVLFAPNAQGSAPRIVLDQHALSPFARVEAVLTHLGRALRFLPRVVLATLYSVVRAQLGQRRGGARPTGVLESRNMSFNECLTARRKFVPAMLPFSRLHALAKATRCTVNDVFLAVCSGALRSYLREHHEVVSSSLIASVPLSLGAAPYTPMRGNRVASVFADLATDDADPLHRLKRIKGRMDAAKARRERQSIDVERLLDLLPPLVFDLPVRLFRRLVRRHRVASPVNLVISNVHGPSRSLERCGRPVVAQWFVGPLIEGVGLNITAWSYQETMHIGLLTCPDLPLDLVALRDALEPSLCELERVVAATRSCSDAMAGNRDPEVTPSPANLASRCVPQPDLASGLSS